MDMKKILSVFLILFLLILFNGFQVLNYYITRISGDIDFNNIGTHIVTFFVSISSLISTLISWKWLSKMKVKRLKFMYAFLLTLPLFASFTSVIYVLARFSYGLSTPIEYLRNNLMFTLSFSHFYVSGFTIAYLFFNETNILEKELAKAKHEMESMQLQMLKKNMEPHFLFNNLSILSSLARKDLNQVDGFIEELADVYRYFLVHNAFDTVPLKEELTFLRKYISLTNRRFDTAYCVLLDIDNEDGFIIPFALQICLENAIKHNEGSPTNPLSIEIKRDGDIIRITNPIRLVENTFNTGLGLSNITKRHQFLFDRELFFGVVNDNFVVEVPIIQIK
jgi:two-component system, LytTR family, sensor kinase